MKVVERLDGGNRVVVMVESHILPLTLYGNCVMGVLFHTGPSHYSTFGTSASLKLRKIQENISA